MGIKSKGQNCTRFWPLSVGGGEGYVEIWICYQPNRAGHDI